ncbi:MAG: DedA family protein [Acetobacteraceae bacterium]|nr:DedA family protein [Acetobacteraceae bacterium]
MAFQPSIALNGDAVHFISSLHMVHLVQTYGSGLIGLVTALEAMGLPLPAESLLIATSVYADTSGKISIVQIVAAVAAGAIIGDNIGFGIGHTLGARALRRWGHWIGLDEDRLLLGAYLFRRHGGKVVFFGRFIAILRTFSALLAGANGMHWPRFVVANAAGGVCWACLWGFGAYGLGDAVNSITGPIGITAAILAAVIVGGGWLYLRKREKELVQRAKETMRAR